MSKEVAIAKIKEILNRYASGNQDTMQRLAEKIYKEVVETSVEAERDFWIGSSHNAGTH